MTYSSIGLCHACIDTSALITNTTAEANKSSDIVFSMPNGLQLNSQLNLASGPLSNNFSVESKLFTPEFAAVASDSIANVTILTLTEAPCSDSPGYAACNNSFSTFIGSRQRALAVSCALHPCIQRFHGAVTNGHLDEVVVSTSPASKSMSLPNDRNSMMNYTALEIPCLIDNQPYDLSNFSRLDRTRHNFTDVVINGTTVPAPFECVYILEAIYARALAAYLNGGNQPDFTGNLLAGTCVNNVNTLGLNCGNGKFWLENFWGSGGTGGGAPTLATVSEVVARFAKVMSRHFRRAGSTLYTRPRSLDDPFPGIPRPALGTVHTTTVCVAFAWAWLLWLVALYLATVALLVVALLGGAIRVPRQAGLEGVATAAAVAHDGRAGARGRADGREAARRVGRTEESAVCKAGRARCGASHLEGANP